MPHQQLIWGLVCCMVFFPSSRTRSRGARRLFQMPRPFWQLIPAGLAPWGCRLRVWRSIGLCRLVCLLRLTRFRCGIRRLRIFSGLFLRELCRVSMRCSRIIRGLRIRWWGLCRLGVFLFLWIFWRGLFESLHWQGFWKKCWLKDFMICLRSLIY